MNQITLLNTTNYTIVNYNLKKKSLYSVSLRIEQWDMFVIKKDKKKKKKNKPCDENIHWIT